MEAHAQDNSIENSDTEMSKPKPIKATTTATLTTVKRRRQ